MQTQNATELTPLEKQVLLRELREEIDRRCSFFRILTDIGAKNSSPKKPDSVTQNKKHALPR